MRSSAILLLLISSFAEATGNSFTGYEYIIVGSGAGGGPLAARLALAGHKTLLLEAGDDQGLNVNYTVPAYSAKATEDEALAWNFYVKHYGDEGRQARDFKTTYKTPDGSDYTGLHPPEGSIMKGTLYPRAGTLGGCTAHNAMVAVYPHRSDFDYIANLTGDDSWSADNMRKYFVELEKNQYLSTGVDGHGYTGWLSTETAPITSISTDVEILSLLTGGGNALGHKTNRTFNLASVLSADPNSAALTRDKSPGFYQVPISTTHGRRIGSRDFVVTVRDAVNKDGTKKYPLDVMTDCFVTKVAFNQTVTPPRAVGVDFLMGKNLYRASPLSQSGFRGIPGSATASREVIVAGGAYNSPQILKLSGIGPSAELKKFDIPVVVDLPGVGTNLQDHYEVVVQGRVPVPFIALAACTFGGGGYPDPCEERWKFQLGTDRGIYASGGFAAAMFMKSNVTENDEFDVFIFGGPVNFRGYFPQYSVNITAHRNWFSWAILKAHPRNNYGTVNLISADPLDMPEIIYNYFDTGVGNYSADLQALTEAVALARDAFAKQSIIVDEILPGEHIVAQADVESYIKDTAWGHHASSTCPIGSDNDPMAVLDSNFKVRGVEGLRVVDASVYPRIPGTFTAVSTYMVAEKAADVILAALK